MANKTFDELVKEGALTKAVRLFAKEYYEIGRMGYTRKMVIEEIADRLDRLEKKSQWIPIEKKLPRKGTYVLASFDDGFVSAVEFADDWELWADSGEVIAWQPLPKAYKKSKKSNAI